MTSADTNLLKSGPIIPEAQQNLKENISKSFVDMFCFGEQLAWKEYGLVIHVAPQHFMKVMLSLKDDPQFHFEMLMDVTCVDWLDSKDERFEIIYQLLSLKYNTRLCVKVSLPESKPEIDSVRSLWSSANFLEREVFDMFGVVFKGHGDLRRILMYDEFIGHPLRKDYPLKGKQPRIELRIPELRNTSADLHRDSLVAMPKKKIV